MAQLLNHSNPHFWQEHRQTKAILQSIPTLQLYMELKYSTKVLILLCRLVMGKVDAIPVAIIRGFDYERGEGTSSELVRGREFDLFL